MCTVLVDRSILSLINLSNWEHSEASHLGLKDIKLFSCSTGLNILFIQLINVKMPTIVSILTFLSKINTSLSFLKPKNLLFQHISFYELLKFHAQLHFITSDLVCTVC